MPRQNPPGKARKFWTVPTALASVPFGPGQYSLYGYKLGRMRGLSRTKATALGAKEEVKARTLSGVGAAAGYATVGRPMVRASKELWTRNSRPLLKAAKTGGVKRIAKAVWGAAKDVAKHPVVRKAWVRQTIGGWAGYLLPAYAATKAYQKQYKKSANYWKAHNGRAS